MSPRSLRLRLLGGAAIAIFISLAAAWLAMTLLFERHIERRVRAELIQQALQLIAALKILPDGQLALDPVATDSRFAEPASGLYWQLSTDSGVVRSRSLWDQALPLSPTARSADWHTRTTAGPFEQRLYVLERVIQPDRDGPEVLVQVAHDHAALSAARDEFGRELAMFLTLLWLILSAAAWIQVQLGLRPLTRVRHELQALQHNAAARMSGEHPTEVQPLASAINALADAREKDLARARRRAADLAHALKTPLAALAAQSRHARDAGATEAADGLDRAIAAAAAAVEAELTRMRAASIRPESGAECAARPVIEAILGVVERTDFGAAFVCEIQLTDDMRVPVSAEDLTELMGPLTENAARFARRRACVSGSRDATTVRLVVSDDGPGISEAAAQDLEQVSGRLDEAGARRGLGLSIARDLAEATGAQLHMKRSALGGLQVDVIWRI